MAGKILAQMHPADADIVVGVPESGNVAAMGFALHPESHTNGVY